MTHRTALVWLVSLVLCVVCAGSVPARPANSPQPGNSILFIRRQYAIINRNQAKYQRVKKELSGFSTEGGELTAYFAGRSIMKIVATYYGESGKAREEYYYWDGQLIFVLRREFAYDKPLSGKVLRTREHRLYFNKQKLIKWISEDGKDIPPNETEYLEEQNKYLQSSAAFTEGARSSNSNITAPD